MRGKAKVASQHEGTRGITPAYAGKSNIEMISKIAHQDHPRLCGEKSFFI